MDTDEEPYGMRWWCQPIIDAAESGLTIERVAELFGCSRETVIGILSVYCEGRPPV